MRSNNELRMLAAERNLSRQNLAKILGVSPETVRNWLRNPNTSNFRVMPEPMLELLKIKLET